MGAGEIVEMLNEPINKLIDSVSGAIGKAYQPRHIRKMAEAKAYEIKMISEQLRENSDVPIIYDAKGISMDTTNFEDLAKRASSRLAYQEIKKQENIDSVVDNAYSELEGKELESEENVDNDWMIRFINSVEDISNEKMQIIWGKILAGEIINPNSVSLRTLDILRNLSKNEAKLFEKICNYIINERYIYNDDDILKKYEIIYADMLNLADYGLINSSMLLSNNININENEVMLFKNDEYIVMAKSNTENIEISLPIFLLSEAGKELSKIVNKKVNSNYIFDVANDIKEKNQNINVAVYKITSIIDNNVTFERENLLNQ
ncbi:MAG: DUF2806 domain-containing protein [Clostridium perfringens]|uniref:DUF2806 domain-containing protein n=1 Tax=Clostridium perfringens TaxID=1502 RepID=UPI0018E4678A|nr:DUF2806 domain-containing protein [Clostridium perfringens]MBI5993026.1 DUF2806 domain-containing protein [Clostridium perfringens]MDK0724780.1 DUF2806 domain-containing protein [Clostridium perfringens]MDN4737293.1 DUF2806 domain-containing protein [Clostridium perfringens]MDN4740161.1 DUF2806 domain-containing protein [Clostridium perfringens]